MLQLIRNCRFSCADDTAKDKVMKTEKSSRDENDDALLLLLPGEFFDDSQQDESE